MKKDDGGNYRADEAGWTALWETAKRKSTIS